MLCDNADFPSIFAVLSSFTLLAVVFCYCLFVSLSPPLYVKIFSQTVCLSEKNYFFSTYDQKPFEAF